MKKSYILPLIVLGVLSWTEAIPMSRLIGGTKSDLVPYHVHMWVYDRFNYTWPGSGVLITKSHVLTAAVNVHNFVRWDLGIGGTTQRKLEGITSYKAFVHENFDDETNDNNLAIIIMPKPAKFSKIIAPISLPLQNEHIPTEGQIGKIAAFSYLSDYGPISTTLEFGKQKILSDIACENVYPHLNGIVSHFFCATDEKFNVCGGAQGAGLVITQNKREVLAGIVSFGSIWHNCSSRTPPGFIKVSEYVDWIVKKTDA